jgi:hypothetical protein
MPRVEFEPTIPMLKRAKTIHALGSAATVIGQYETREQKTLIFIKSSILLCPALA